MGSINQTMIRKLVDYKKLNHEAAALLIENYPHGYGDSDIIAFRNMNGEIIEAVELQTEDTLYLVKISKSLSIFISNFEDNMEKELNTNNMSLAQNVDSNAIDLHLNMEQEYIEDSDLD